MSVVKKDEYYGKPILKIFKDEDAEKPVISFGLQKAKAIVEAIEEIKQFVEETEK